MVSPALVRASLLLCCARLAGGSSLLSAPFSRTALWAADVLRTKRGKGRGPPPAASLLAANYCLNNARLALPGERLGQLDSAAAALLAAQKGGASAAAAEQAVSEVLTAVDGLRDLLGAAAPRSWDAPRGIGCAFRNASAPLPAVAGGALPGAASVPLSSGVHMPLVGLGTWMLTGKSAEQQIAYALDLGYRHIDTAQAYRNEADVGRAMKRSAVPRDEIFLATKLSNFLPDGQPPLVKQVLERQLRELQTSYIDLYIIHSMREVESPERFEELLKAWRILEGLVDEGKVRSLGVSNCNAAILQKLYDAVRVKPTYIQNKFSVYFPQDQTIEAVSLMGLASRLNISMMGYSVINAWPFVLPPLEDPHVLQVAGSAGRSASQVLHRWVLQLGGGVIPRSSQQQHVKENLQLFDFQLDDQAMAALNGLAVLYHSFDRRSPPFVDDVFGLFSPPMGRNEL